MDRHQYLNQFHPITAADYALLMEHLKARRFAKGDFITVQGQVQKELYLVKSGVQMSYFDSGHKQHTLAFTYYPDICAIPESLSFQCPSPYFLSCISDSELDAISYSDLLKVFDQSQQLERLFRRMTEAVLAGMIRRHIELHAMTMEERYRVFCQRSPHLLQLVPHKYIASYLAIDPTNFSKLYNRVKF